MRATSSSQFAEGADCRGGQHLRCAGWQPDSYRYPQRNPPLRISSLVRFARQEICESSCILCYTRDNQDSGERSVLREVVLVDALCTALVHNGVMTAKEKTVRQSVTLPAKVATQVRNMAKRRRLSANQMLIELVEEGLEAKQQKEKAFFALAERFRAAADPKEVERLGEELGHMVFGK